MHQVAGKKQENLQGTEYQMKLHALLSAFSAEIEV